MTATIPGGGAATAGGMGFQNRVAAWIAVRILAEQAQSRLWDLPPSVQLSVLRCEAGQPVDDILVETSLGGFVYIQVKRGLSLSDKTASPFASAIDQFVRQFIHCNFGTSPNHPWEERLDPAIDRFVLAISPGTSKALRVHLPAILNRMRLLANAVGFTEAAVNEEERRALRTLTTCVERSWRQLRSADPSPAEIVECLAFLYIHIADVEESGVGEREARQILRTVVLGSSDSDVTAWACLVDLCGRLASGRSGIDRNGLRKELLSAGLRLASPTTYRADIERLRRHSGHVVALLDRLSDIRVLGTSVKITRPSTRALRSVAAQGSTLVVGDPGAGKSAALHDVVLQLLQEGQDVVFLAVDHLTVRDMADFRRALGIEHDLVEVLLHWEGRGPAFLVIDALDAARADASAAIFRDLIQLVTSAPAARWHVIASIRKFDLRYGRRLQELFRGSPADGFRDQEFSHLRHLSVPLLSSDELSQVSRQSTALRELISQAHPALRGLLRVPFHLRLLGELLDLGETPAELSPVRTQLQLLERYWLHRVIGEDGESDAREGVLRRICNVMTSTRGLRIERASLNDIALTAARTVNALLSSNVIVEWQPTEGGPADRDVVAFAHNILFDYAVARLLLRVEPGTVAQMLVTETDLVIVIRPSFVFHFQYLWARADKGAFWALVFGLIATSGVPEVARLIGPAVAAQLFERLSDADELFRVIDSQVLGESEVGETALRHMVGAVLAIRPTGGEPGHDGPWPELMDRATTKIRRSVAYGVRPLLTNMCAQPDSLASDQTILLNRVAQRILVFAWDDRPRDRWLVIDGIQCVARTAWADLRGSIELLRRALSDSHLRDYGSEEMYWFANEARRLVKVDSAFVVEIFRVSFGREEVSEESSEIGTGRIMPLISTRRQDWESARFQLAEMYPEFLREAPRDAARALIATVEGYVANRRRVRTAEEAEGVFEGLGGERLRIQEDYSSVWDSEGAPGIDEPHKMLDALEKFVEGGGQKRASAEGVDAVFDVLVGENRLAVIWRRLLRMGAKLPATVGERLRFLAWARPILGMRDTSSEAGEFLRGLYSRLSVEEKGRVERTILSFGGETGEGTRTRDRLLGCLPVDGLVTEEAGNVLRDLVARNAVPQNIPVVRFSSGWVGRYSEEEDLADEGVPVSQEANRRIRELERPLKAFNEKFLNSTPSAEEVAGISEALGTLAASLREKDPRVHEKQRNYAWGTLAAACAAIAKGDALDCGSQIGATVRACLLLASAEAVPEPDPEQDARFDASPSWGGPAARVEAAAGLTHLLYHSTCCGQDVEAAVERLVVDAVPAVRFQVALRLAALYRTRPEMMWRLIEHISESDSSKGVLNALLVGPIVRLAGRHPEEAGRVARRILHRVEIGSPGAGEVRRAAVGVLVGLDVWRQNRGAREEVEVIVGGLPLTADLVRDIIGNLRDAVAAGPAANPDRAQEDVRRRAISIVGRVLDAVVLVVRECDQRVAVPGRQLSDSERAELQIYVRLADHIATELYFASGAYDTRNERGPETGVMRRFWEEGRGLLASVAAIGYPSVVHHLLETLEALVTFDPREVFLLVHRALQAGVRGGYQYEPLGAKLFVALVERYLAEYAALLRTDRDCRHALLAALDIFVRAGWPDARRLTYRLDEIFR